MGPNDYVGAMIVGLLMVGVATSILWFKPIGGFIGIGVFSVAISFADMATAKTIYQEIFGQLGAIFGMLALCAGFVIRALDGYRSAIESTLASPLRDKGKAD